MKKAKNKNKQKSAAVSVCSAVSEKKELTAPERLWNQLTYMPHTSAAIRKTIPPVYVRRFMEIMTSEKAVEVDWLVLCGHMTHDQADQYWSVTGDHATCRQELMELAIAVADEFRPKLIQLISNEIKGLRKEGIDNVFETLISLFLSRISPIEHLEVSNPHLGEEFMMRVMALIGSDLIDIQKSTEVNEIIRIEAGKCLANAERFFRDAIGIEFVGSQFQNEKFMYRLTLDKYSCYLDATIGFACEHDEEYRLRIIAQNETLFSDIKREVLYKRVTLVTMQDKQPQIVGISENPESGDRCSSLCTVRINFNKEKVGFPALKTDVRGCVYYDYGVRLGIINLTLNTETGDLCFITGGIPFSRIISENRYLLLQNYVFRKLKAYLEGKDPDIEDLFMYSQDELAAQKQTANLEECGDDAMCVSSAQESIGSAEKIPADEEESSLWRYVPFRRKHPSVEQAVEVVEEVPLVRVLPKHLRMVVMDRISGANAHQTLAALRRMLGREEKTEGSHLFFRSDRTGLLLPVPRHSRKDKHHISSPLILSNLAQWGYSPMEFAAELGVEIPEKIMMQESVVALTE